MTATETTTSRPDGLTLLEQLVDSPIPQIVTVENLCKDGFSETEASSILRLGSRIADLQKEISFLKSEYGKHVMEKEADLRKEQFVQMTKSGQDTFNLVSKLKLALLENAGGTSKAFRMVVSIYITAFVMGVLLMVTAVVFGAMDKPILAVAFGAIGLVNMMTYFFKMPASQIQESRSNLSQMQVVLLVWLKDFINNDAMLIANQSIEAYTALSEVNIKNTTTLLGMLQDLAEPKA